MVKVYTAESEMVDFFETNQKLHAFISHVLLESPILNAP